jgi:hypothetical protein
LTAHQISTSIEAVRRLAVTKQHLAGRLPVKPTGENILSMVRDLAYVQWDPITTIAPSHIISLWSRVGNFRLSDLYRLLWEEKKLLPALDTYSIDRAHGRLSGLLFPDEKIPRISLEFLESTHGESQEVPGRARGITQASVE